MKETYSFEIQEFLALAKFFRKFQKELPAELFDFSKFIENEIYANMTLEEVCKFYNEE